MDEFTTEKQDGGKLDRASKRTIEFPAHYNCRSSQVDYASQGKVAMDRAVENLRKQEHRKKGE